MTAADTLDLLGATLADGSVVDVSVVDGVITGIAPARRASDARDRAEAGLDREAAIPVVDLTGRLLLPAFAEPHAHLDKAFLAETVANPSGDLIGAITAMRAHASAVTVEDAARRAERAARLLLRNGATAIRTHADLTQEGGLTSVEALLQVRERLRGLVDIQVCALTGWPVCGADGAPQRALLCAAIEAGVDLVGGCAHLESDPGLATETLLTIAAEAGLPVDLHTDETLDPAMLAIVDLARRVIDSGFPHPVTASHCVSLGMQPEERQREIAALIAEAGISVVALPQTNLFLQGRDRQCAMPRGLTAVRALTAAGVNVAAGADNLQDPFNPLGRGDPLETAALMIAVGHLLPHDAFESVSGRSRLALGLEPGAVAVGARADLVALPAASLREAIAMAPPGRIVLRAGRIVAGEESGPEPAS